MNIAEALARHDEVVDRLADDTAHDAFEAAEAAQAAFLEALARDAPAREALGLLDLADAAWRAALARRVELQATLRQLVQVNAVLAGAKGLAGLIGPQAVARQSDPGSN